jgi:hypothetical protein
MSELISRNLSERTVSYVERTRFSARQRLFSPKQSSTGDRSDDIIYRWASR